MLYNGFVLVASRIGGRCQFWYNIMLMVVALYLAMLMLMLVRMLVRMIVMLMLILVAKGGSSDGDCDRWDDDDDDCYD